MCAKLISFTGVCEAYQQTWYQQYQPRWISWAGPGEREGLRGAHDDGGVHDGSGTNLPPRRQGPCIQVNCLPNTLKMNQSFFFSPQRPSKIKLVLALLIRTLLPLPFPSLLIFLSVSLSLCVVCSVLPHLLRLERKKWTKKEKKDGQKKKSFVARHTCLSH